MGRRTPSSASDEQLFSSISQFPDVSKESSWLIPITAFSTTVSASSTDLTTSIPASGNRTTGVVMSSAAWSDANPAVSTPTRAAGVAAALVLSLPVVSATPASRHGIRNSPPLFLLPPSCSSSFPNWGLLFLLSCEIRTIDGPTTVFWEQRPDLTRPSVLDACENLILELEKFAMEQRAWFLPRISLGAWRSCCSASPIGIPTKQQTTNLYCCCCCLFVFYFFGFL